MLQSRVAPAAAGAESSIGEDARPDGADPVEADPVGADPVGADPVGANEVGADEDFEAKSQRPKLQHCGQEARVN